MNREKEDERNLEKEIENLKEIEKENIVRRPGRSIPSLPHEIWPSVRKNSKVPTQKITQARFPQDC